MLTNCLAACAHLSITISEIQRDIREKIDNFSYTLTFDAPVRGFPSEYQHPLWYGKTRMVSLPDGEKNFEDGRTPGDGNSRAIRSIARQ